LTAGADFRGPIVVSGVVFSEQAAIFLPPVIILIISEK
jgi:hypothetical protein